MAVGEKWAGARNTKWRWLPITVSSIRVEQAQGVRVAYLPTMSVLTDTDTRLDGGAINVRLVEGRTAEVLRNLCHQMPVANLPRTN